MARNGSGNYSLPPGYLAVNGLDATAAQHNDPLEDIEADLNTARPVVAGGTGATTAADARTNLGLSLISDSGIDTDVLFTDNADATKKLSISLTSVTTATTRTWTLPDFDDTFVGRTGTQTLTNKTLTSPDINGGTVDGAVIGGSTAAAGSFTDIDGDSLTIAGATPVVIDSGKIGFNGIVNDYWTHVTTEGAYFYENGTEIGRIGASGTTTRFQAAYDQTTASAANVYVGSAGGLARSTSLGAFKTDRVPITDGSVILLLQPTQYKSLHAADEGATFWGFIFEELLEVFPEAAMPDGENYNDRAIMAAVVAFLKTLNGRVEALEA